MAKLNYLIASRAPNNGTDFGAICAATGKQAKCCAIPVVSIVSSICVFFSLSVKLDRTHLLTYTKPQGRPSSSLPDCHWRQLKTSLIC